MGRVEFQAKRIGQVDRSLMSIEVVNLTPQVEYVTRDAAGWMETLVYVPAKVCGEGSPTGSLRPMDGTWTASLKATATEAIEVAEVTEHTLQRDLAAEIWQVNGTGTGRVVGWRLCLSRFVDDPRCIPYGSIGRGDRFTFRGYLRFAARGLFFVSVGRLLGGLSGSLFLFLVLGVICAACRPDTEHLVQ